MNEKKLVKALLSWVKTLMLAVLVGVIVNTTLLASAHVVSGSMENTIMTDSRVMGLRVAYLFNEPGRFDVILFNSPNNDSPVPYVKRIIGIPSEKVEIINGKIFIDDSNIPLDDYFIKEVAQGNAGPFFVPEGCYFVLGDNRDGSSDSRHWENRYVPREYIIGRLYLIYFPSPQMLD